MSALLACLCTALGEAGWEGDCCLESGPVAWDQCCADADGGGKAWARFMGLYPSERFPATSPPADPTKCDTQWGAQIELGAITCVCFDMCDCAVKTANTTKIMDMVDAAMLSMACCAADSCGTDVRVASLQTSATEGGCGGFAMTVVVPHNFCCPPEAP